jgi:hypothetical protein
MKFYWEKAFEIKLDNLSWTIERSMDNRKLFRIFRPIDYDNCYFSYTAWVDFEKMIFEDEHYKVSIMRNTGDGQWMERNRVDKKLTRLVTTPDVRMNWENEEIVEHCFQLLINEVIDG